MKSTRSSAWRRIVAGVASLALMGLGLGATAGAAQADTGNLDPNAATSLSIHKYDGNPGTAGDGSKLADTSGLGNPLAGVEFTVTPVTSKNGTPIDLTSEAGWNLIKGATASTVTAANGYAFGTPVKLTTDASGTATSALPKALYLVTETGHGANQVVSDVDPFLVTLPLPQGNGKWLYDVHVYPKNVVNKTVPTKTVADPSAPVLGSIIPWTITAPVPAKGANDTYKSFSITDTLDARLSYDSLTVAGYTAGTDYTVTQTGQTVKVAFTATGLAKLKAGDNVVVTLKTKVTSVGDGVIKNSALVNTNGSEKSTDTTTPPSTNWGVVKVSKVADGDPSKTLAGAKFEVYAAKNGQPVGTMTTAADGTAQLELWVGNNDVTSKDYFLKEVAAPAGYVLPADPWTQVTVKAGTTTNTAYTIKNVQQGHPDLPLTGANGQLLLTIVGAAVVLLAVGAGIVTSRRRRKA